MTYGERIKKIRQYLDLRQEDFADVIGVKKSAVSMIEKSLRNLSVDHIQRLLEKYNINPQYFFGLIDSPEEADMSKEKAEPTYTDLVNEVREIKRKVRPIDDIDPDAKWVMMKPEIRQIVKRIRFLDANALRAIDGLIYGYMGHDAIEENEKRERLA